ncbi:hypothetical protein STEG23_025060 [Scotinomys teguina]
MLGVEGGADPTCTQSATQGPLFFPLLQQSVVKLVPLFPGSCAPCGDWARGIGETSQERWSGKSSRTFRFRTGEGPRLGLEAGGYPLKSWGLDKRVNMMLRKIAVAAASKPTVEIKQEDDSFYIKTSTTVRTTEINFKIGEEFEEQTVDGRPCKSLVKWESENKMVCEQRLLKGEGPKTSWTRELTNDGELILVYQLGTKRSNIGA